MVRLRNKRVADYLVDRLCAAGVTHLFGVDGANIEDLFDAAYFRPELTAVLAKHEFVAATMADGYSRCGAGLGVVAATSGGGCLNLVAGIGEAFASRVPLLALVGQAPTTLDGRGSFQDTSGRNGSLDAMTLFGAVSLFCRRVTTPAGIVEALPEAIAAAARGGPAVLLLPKDIQQAVLDIDSAVVNPVDRPRRIPRIQRGAPIVELLSATQGPVTIVAGEQVARDDARAELEQLRKALQANVACTPDALDVAQQDALPTLGVVGIMGHPATAVAIRESAVCLLVGTRLPVTAGGGLEDALACTEVFSIGSAEPYPPCNHLPTDDLRQSLGALASALTPPGHRGTHRVDAPVHLVPPVYAGGGVRYRDIMATLDEVLPDTADIVVDAGNTGAAAIHYLPSRRHGRFLVALGMGGMGYSFGAGIGVAFGRGRRTLVIAGDGAFFMHGMEMHTAIQYRLPVTFVLLNNNAHAMCVTREQLYYANRYSYNRFGHSQLGHGVAAMFPGLPAAEVDEVGQLRRVLTDAIGQDGPSVVSVACSADEIPPFAPFLATLESGHVHDNTPISEEGQAHVPASA